MIGATAPRPRLTKATNRSLEPLDFLPRAPFISFLCEPLPTRPAGRGVPGQSTSDVRSTRVRNTPSILLYGHTIMCFWVSEYNSESVPSAALDAIFFCTVRSVSFCCFNAYIRVSPVRSWEHLNNRWN